MSKFGFGTPSTTQQSTPGAPAFGVASPAPSFGGFGAPAAQTTATPSGFAFGSTPATTTTGFGFGAPASTPQQSFGLGSTQSISSGGGFMFSSPTPVSSAAPAPLSGLSGLAASAAKATPFSTPLSFTSNPTTSAPTLNFNTLATSTGLNFSSTTVTTSAPLFNFNTTTTQAQAPGFLGAKAPTLNFAAPATGSGIFGAVLTATTTTTTQSIGLGGIDIATQPKTTEGTDATKIKEAQLPNEIVASVKALEDHIKDQRKSSDIARNFDQKLKKVDGEIETIRRNLSEISNHVMKNYSAIKQLKSETNEAIQNAEMAQRTHETPNGLQFENTAPLKYFLDIIQKYENEMIVFRNQVELTEKHMYSLITPQNLTADDLKRGLYQIHESFIALAGRLHEIHQKVKLQKEQYLNIRKFYLKDYTDVFEEAEKREESRDLSKISKGPTPFSTLTSINFGQTGLSKSSAPTTQAGSSFGNLFGAPGGFSSSGSMFGTGTGGGGIFGSTSVDSSFNLQKPPLGNKRNKP
ncbi:Nuclear pore complex protein Nup58 [Sergentomyia squamirostris]